MRVKRFVPVLIALGVLISFINAYSFYDASCETGLSLMKNLLADYSAAGDGSTDDSAAVQLVGFVQTNGYAPKIHKGPSVAAVKDFANYNIVVSNITAVGYQYMLDIYTEDLPVFDSNPFSKPDAFSGYAYSGSIAGDASDPKSDPLSFSKVSGPAWLSVATSGALSGTPSGSDTGLNDFEVRVDTADGGADVATMNIMVAVPGPSAWDDFVTSHGLSGSKTNHTDSDGLNDWGEYVFGGNPTDPSDIGTLSAFDPSTGKYIFFLIGDDSLVAHVLTNSNLTAGRWGTNSTVHVTATDRAFHSYTNDLTPEAGRLFIRVKVEQ